MQIVLHQFRSSHFNEKARWALDYKGVTHSRVCYLPGPHRGPIRRLSGQSTTPVLEIDGRAVAESALIIDELERRFPEPALYPSDEGLRAEALAVQTRFDAEVGPATRTAAFSVFVNELDYVAKLFARDEPWAKRTVYRAALPMVRGLMAKINGADDPANVAKAIETTDRALDWVAKETRQRPYLVGDGFSVADLTAAALLAPLAEVDHPDMRRPKPAPAAYGALLDRWRDHPALDWVQTQYRKHRPAA